ncbi:hypothetical protein K2X85_06815 [bacterium]|nr:hypothetical protein [bacterium]
MNSRKDPLLGPFQGSAIPHPMHLSFDVGSIPRLDRGDLLDGGCCWKVWSNGTRAVNEDVLGSVLDDGIRQKTSSIVISTEK